MAWEWQGIVCGLRWDWRGIGGGLCAAALGAVRSPSAVGGAVVRSINEDCEVADLCREFPQRLRDLELKSKGDRLKTWAAALWGMWENRPTHLNGRSCPKGAGRFCRCGARARERERKRRLRSTTGTVGKRA